MTGVALCNGVFITDQCKDTSSQCKQTNLYAGLAKEVNFSACQHHNLTTSQPLNIVILTKLNLPGRQPKFANVKLRAGHYFQLRVFLEPGERNSTRKLFWPLQFGLQRNQEVS